MENAIARTFFALCNECPHHGHIVCRDKTTSDEVLTVAGGMNELLLLMMEGRISEYESLDVIKQIRSSGLPEDVPRIDMVMEKAQESVAGAQPIVANFPDEIETDTWLAVVKQTIVRGKRTLH